MAETASSLPRTRLVYVADREAGMLALMVGAQELGTPVDWLICSTHDRAPSERAKLWAATTEGASLGEINFTTGSRHLVKAREVRQHVWLQRIELPASAVQSVAAMCLVAREFDAPGGVKPIKWRFLTNCEARRRRKRLS